MNPFFKKISTFLICANFLLFSCQKAETAPPLPPTKEENSSSPIIIERIPTPDIFKNPDVWDTEDIDISHIQTNRKLIAFTFDDAPSAHSESLVAIFASFNERNPDCKASATVFYNGKRIDSNNKHLLHTAYTLGFELGNHSYSHFNLTTLSSEQLTLEVERTDKLLQEIDGKPLHLFRAPYGKTNELVKQTIQTPLIDWTIDTLDWTKKSAEEIYQSVFSNLFDGAIVLMHDGYENTLSAVKNLLPDLKAAGYQVVSVSVLAKMHNCAMKKGNVYIRLRKQT